MTAIVWDRLEDRIYETGLDRGVLYFPNGGGVPWNGLTAVVEANSTTLEPVYYDGVKFNDIVVPGNFAAKLQAFTYPEEFLEFEGWIEEQSGMYMADQQPSQFHLSYRTLIGSTLDEGYRIHMLWNLTATPSDRTYRTLALEGEPVEFEWSLTSVPEPVQGYRPTSHVILDSRRLDPLLMGDIETILYGDPEDADSVPTMPSLKGFITYVRKWNRLIIIDNGDGTWTATAESDESITMLDATTFEITSESAVYLDPETYEISSTEKNEEDIF